MPSDPPTVFVPPSAGIPPSAPAAVFEPAPTGKGVLVIAGVSTAGINGPVVYCGRTGGRAAWSTNGTLVASGTNTIVEYVSGADWRIARSGVFSATRTSVAQTPDGLIPWSVSLGTGVPTVAAVSAGTPPIITA
jgi:hypothetical protein